MCTLLILPIAGITSLQVRQTEEDVLVNTVPHMSLCRSTNVEEGITTSIHFPALYARRASTIIPESIRDLFYELVLRPTMWATDSPQVVAARWPLMRSQMEQSRDRQHLQHKSFLVTSALHPQFIQTLMAYCDAQPEFKGAFLYHAVRPNGLRAYRSANLQDNGWQALFNSTTVDRSDAWVVEVEVKLQDRGSVCVWADGAITRILEKALPSATNAEVGEIMKSGKWGTSIIQTPQSFVSHDLGALGYSRGVVSFSADFTEVSPDSAPATRVISAAKDLYPNAIAQLHADVDSVAAGYTSAMLSLKTNTGYVVLRGVFTYEVAPKAFMEWPNITGLIGVIKNLLWWYV